MAEMHYIANEYFVIKLKEAYEFLPNGTSTCGGMSMPPYPPGVYPPKLFGVEKKARSYLTRWVSMPGNNHSTPKYTKEDFEILPAVLGYKES